MTLKIVGKSITNELVECFYCDKKFVWLNCYYTHSGNYRAVCSKCKKKVKTVKISIPRK